MSDSYFEKNLGNAISINGVYDKKFKSCLVSIRFITPLDKESSQRYALLSNILSTSNSVINSRSKLNEEMISLYDAVLSAFSYSAGDYQITGLNVRYIGDDYTIDGEKISDKAVRVLLDCILKPDIQNGSFNPKYFELRKRELIDTIKSEINDRRGYAVLRANQTIYQNEPAAIYVNGTVEQAEAITQQELIDAYNQLLKNSYIDISVCGDKEQSEIVDMIADAFEPLNRTDITTPSFEAPSPIKENVAEVFEQNDVNQCKMIMAFKTESDDFYANKVMCALFGGTPFSMLFANVREKLSLCYYCAASVAECKRVMTVDSAVEKENVDKARAEIERQLQAICNGEFSDEMLENTKKALFNGFKSNYDSIIALNSWYFVQRIRGGKSSPDEINEVINSITRERVINAAKSYKLDTVYVMEPEVE